MSEDPSPAFCVDTSSLIAAWEERYPQENFPKFWERIDDLFKASRAFVPEAVVDETDKRSSELHKWLKERSYAAVGYETEIQEAAKSILSTYPLLVKQSKSRFAADPFVIGTARVKRLVVLTEETPSNSGNRPKIPDVCRAMGLECVNLIALIRREKWVVG
jgi:hypothetical protein